MSIHGEKKPRTEEKDGLVQGTHHQPKWSVRLRKVGKRTIHVIAEKRGRKKDDEKRSPRMRVRMGWRTVIGLTSDLTDPRNECAVSVGGTRDDKKRPFWD